jgi:5'-3' exonuclease
MSCLLIDGNSVGFAAQNGGKLSSGGKDTQAIFHFLKSLRKAILEYPGYTPLVLWDGDSWRKKISTEYKSTREGVSTEIDAMRESYKQQRPYIARALKFLGVPQMIASNLEADDLAALIVERNVKKSVNTILLSGDKDWLQLVQPGVMWVDPIRNRTCNHRTFKEVTGYATRQAFSESKCLMGDTSDHIKGVGGIGEKGAKQLLEKYGSVEKFLEVMLGEGAKEVPKKWWDFAVNATGGHELFARNKILLDLTDTSHLPKPEKTVLTKGELDREAFASLCESLDFASILKVLDDWLTPFTGETA